MTWIKICGTTNERDADIAIRAGANALGFIMAESPRQVTDTAAYSIGTIVPKSVETIGVFVNETIEVLVQTAHPQPMEGTPTEVPVPRRMACPRMSVV